MIFRLFKSDSFNLYTYKSVYDFVIRYVLFVRRMHITTQTKQAYVHLESKESSN